MKVAVFGAAGNMGRRYSAILKHLGHEAIPVEIGDDCLAAATGAEKVIVATPTNTHLDVLRAINGHGGPFAIDVLCEKPVVTTAADLAEVLSLKWVNINCVNQYNFLPDRGEQANALSYYNYYNHGKDGLLWDCFQIIGLAKDRIVLAEDSPVWKCVINGVSLCPDQMDQAYVDMIDDFLIGQMATWHSEHIARITNKILNRDASAIAL